MKGRQGVGGMRDVRSGRAAAVGGFSSRRGFTLIEVIISMFVLLVVMTSVFMLISTSAGSLRNSDMLDMAKNIATYTVEYVRSRNVTLDNNFLGTSDWYSDTSTSAVYPGLADLGYSPVEANAHAAALSINTHPATPEKSYSVAPAAFYSSLQGYVSLASNPVAGDPAAEDGNAKAESGRYYDRITNAPYVVRFPANAGTASAITNFAALSGYNARIYTANANQTDNTKPEYDPHYTTTKTGTTAYRGFRVLTQIAARRMASNPDHVYYFDVRVTVFWLVGGTERSYAVSTQLATYGAGT